MSIAPLITVQASPLPKNNATVNAMPSGLKDFGRYFKNVEIIGAMIELVLETTLTVPLRIYDAYLKDSPFYEPNTIYAVFIEGPTNGSIAI